MLGTVQGGDLEYVGVLDAAKLAFPVSLSG